jgi:preprotein translocase SecE subunit
LPTKKKPQSPKNTDDQPTVTRIVAKDTKTKETKSAPVTTKTKASKSAFGKLTVLGTPFVALGRYFKGAWYELKQVRWPNRRATWSLTAAVIAFTAAFTILILLLDALFKYVFQLILG